MLAWLWLCIKEFSSPAHHVRLYMNHCCCSDCLSAAAAAANYSAQKAHLLPPRHQVHPEASLLLLQWLLLQPSWRLHWAY
jgi:hypothetical protein